ncbi:hypothetical protein H6G89_29245 [Oscillatoria sp. FACHB-1407]|uniref:hypothetical protein n=1 Tax=Oscillatoria sp. FACHB-1407 TaxID=2692847 RepID=UPI001682A31F|nr:hypothetical protein [Oscillatoria sp. FACHB-1407]MBD2465096.1 hypothetical protein [Oscillatoria sp. FACHB-1407]
MSSEINQQPESDGIQPETIQQVKDILQKLPAKLQTSIPVEEAIAQLQDSLETALVKGYSYEELADLLQHEGIPIKSSSLENYLASTRRQASETKTSTKSEDQRSDNLSDQVEIVIPITTGSVSHTVRSDFWTAYQESLKEREEVYRRLAES